MCVCVSERESERVREREREREEEEEEEEEESLFKADVGGGEACDDGRVCVLRFLLRLPLTSVLLRCALSGSCCPLTQLSLSLSPTLCSCATVSDARQAAELDVM